MAREDFNVIIMHGRANEYKKVKKIVEKLEFTPIILKEKYSGELLLNKVRNNVWEKAHCAIIVMTPDDITKERKFRARQNVIFELGYCLGAFDSIPDNYWYNAIIILKEESVENFADIDGLEYISYLKTIKVEDLNKLAEALNDTFKSAKKYYGEL